VVESLSITVQLVGGLGNQLFGYYAGKYLAELRETDLVLDLSRQTLNFHNRSSILDTFLIEEINAKDGGGVSWVPSRKHTEVLLSKVPRWLFDTEKIATKYLKYFRARGLGWESTLDSVSNGSTITGYFQTYKYFMECHSQMSPPTMTPARPSRWFIEKSKEAREERPVVVHLRRGDYQNPINSFMGVLSATYFKDAIDYLLMSPEYRGSEIWIFSDSLALAQEELKSLGRRLTFINQPESSPAVESMSLFSMGRASIISNSTFSYWGAMFSKASTTIAPKKWFKSAHDPHELIPPNWLRHESVWGGGGVVLVDTYLTPRKIGRLTFSNGTPIGSPAKVPTLYFFAPCLVSWQFELCPSLRSTTI